MVFSTHRISEIDGNTVEYYYPMGMEQEESCFFPNKLLEGRETNQRMVYDGSKFQYKTVLYTYAVEDTSAVRVSRTCHERAITF